VFGLYPIPFADCLAKILFPRMSIPETLLEERLVSRRFLLARSVSPLNLSNFQEEAHIDAAIQRSVDEQNALLDAMELRRFSISSTGSTLSMLTELSTSSEEPERNTGTTETPPAPFTHVLSDVTNTIPHISDEAAAMGAVGTPEMSSTVFFELCSAAIDAVGHTSKKAPASPSKKVKKRRRLKKKTSADTTQANQAFGHKHQFERMKKFMHKKVQEKSRQTRMQGKLYKQALERAIVVPFELEGFRPTRGINFQPRVYRHEELAALGIRTISWDGQ